MLDLILTSTLFVHKLFQPSLMFASWARAYPSERVRYSYERSHLSLTLKYCKRLKDTCCTLPKPDQMAKKVLYHWTCEASIIYEHEDFISRICWQNLQVQSRVIKLFTIVIMNFHLSLAGISSLVLRLCIGRRLLEWSTFMVGVR